MERLTFASSACSAVNESRSNSHHDRGLVLGRTMKVFFGLFALLAAMLLPPPSPAQAQTSQKDRTFTGCLTAANGLLLLQQSGGHAYALHGNTEGISKHLDHILEVQGTPEKPQNPN